MCSAMGQQAMVIDAIQAGAKDFIVKPFQADRVLEAIRKHLVRIFFRRCRILRIKQLCFIGLLLLFALGFQSQAYADQLNNSVKDCLNSPMHAENN